MTRLPSLIILSAVAVALASTALAEISVTGAEKVCKEHLSAQEPAPSSVKADKEATRATGSAFTYLFKVKVGETTTKVLCTVDRESEKVTSVKPAA